MARGKAQPQKSWHCIDAGGAARRSLHHLGFDRVIGIHVLPNQVMTSRAQLDKPRDFFDHLVNGLTLPVARPPLIKPA